MSDVDFHDETGNQPGTVSIDVGGQVFTALADPRVYCTVERVFTTIDAACRKAGGPISFTKRELVKPVGVGVKAIGNALERLRTDNRVTTERRGQRYWYQTVWERSIAEQGQLGLVNVSAITSRPAPVTRLDQLDSTVHAGSAHPEGTGREPGENPEGTGREPGGNRAGTRREPGGNRARTRSESGGNQARTRSESGGNQARTRSESGGNQARTRSESGGNQARTRSESGGNQARTRSESGGNQARTRSESGRKWRRS